jgi:CMP/dCMP kinase
MKKPIVITIDGPSSSGKGTIGELLASKLKFHFLDSGAVYRVLAYAAHQKNLSSENEDSLVKLAKNLKINFKFSKKKSLQVIFHNVDISRKIRNEEIASLASKIAANSRVRKLLLKCQQSFLKAPGLVADGRDMGTVVFKHAPFKFFLVASTKARAERRLKQLQENKINASLIKILADLRKRDRRDKNRRVAPLKPAKDAVVIDTTKLSIEQVLDMVLKHLKLGGLGD